MKFAIIFACALAVASAGHIVAPVAYHDYYHGAQHLPIIGADGVPVDTAANQHARAAHYVHKAHAHARNGDYHYAHYDHHDHHYDHHAAPVAYAGHHVAHVAHVAAPLAHHHAYPTTHVLPAAVHGVPLDTPEVAAAKAHHFAAHHEAIARTAHHHLYRKRRGIVAAPLAYSHYAAPLAYATYDAHYHGPQHLPIIGADGVPVDTAAVQHARAAHHVHKAHAIARNGDYHYDHYAHHAYAPWAHYY